jgi:hypothetical protein
MTHLEDDNVGRHDLSGAHAHEVAHDHLGPQHLLEDQRAPVQHLRLRRVRLLVCLVARHILQALKYGGHHQHHEQRDEHCGVAVGVADRLDAL